jgi:hypothetical protein
MTRCVDLVVPRRWRLAALANGRWPPFRAPINALKAPIGPALRVPDRVPKGQLYRSRGGHYDPYKGGEDDDNVVRVEIEFLHRHAALSSAS